MAEHQNIVGLVVRALRVKKGLTQAQLVAKPNIAGWDLSRATLSKIEAQLRCVADHEIPTLAACLGVNPAELVSLAVANAPRRRSSLLR